MKAKPIGRSIKLTLKFLVALLIMASASRVGAQTIQTLCIFGGANGAWPLAGLTPGTDGNFYGTTEAGGSGTNINNIVSSIGVGTVFQVTTNGTLTTLVSFTYTNGENPGAALTLGSDGNFYGTTSGGGSGGDGTVFRITTNGVLTTLASFTGTNGANPQVALAMGPDGAFYGTTEEGGSSNDGTVFQVTTNGMLTPLVSFTNTNGANPYAGLTLGPDGNFYGTTVEGDSNEDGTVFRVTTNGTLTTLISFANTNGAYPQAALTLGPNGNFYGTTKVGGNSDDGTVFQVTTNGLLTTLVSFAYTNGANPQAALTLGPDGNFYGTTEYGGSSGEGTVFRVTTNGLLTTLVSFTGNLGIYPNGANPQAGLVLGRNGNFYGTTADGAITGYGTVFCLSLPAPIVAVQPSSQTNHAGSAVMFNVGATNSVQMNYSYQWLENGTNLVDGGNISGATTSTLIITDISDSDAANYSVIVSDGFGAVTSSNATLTVNDLPFIATQPLSQTVGGGSNVTFTASAYGAPPLVFQWYFGNSPVGSPTTGTNVSSYTLTDVQPNQSGNYSVHVFNGSGSAVSSNAVLTVQVFPPSIGTQPTNQSVLLGDRAAFTVSVNGGTAPFFYQWRLNSTNILNATNAAYAIHSVSTNDAGNYSVVITNSAGSVTSSNALLTVIVPPSLTLQFLAGYPLLDLNGMLSSNFIVQYSTNLAGTNWINLLSVSNLTTSPYQFLDPAGQGQPVRFYRTIMQ